MVLTLYVVYKISDQFLRWQSKQFPLGFNRNPVAIRSYRNPFLNSVGSFTKDVHIIRFYLSVRNEVGLVKLK